MSAGHDYNRYFQCKCSTWSTYCSCSIVTQTTPIGNDECAAQSTKAEAAQEQAEVRTKKIKSVRGQWWNKSPWSRK